MTAIKKFLFRDSAQDIFSCLLLPGTFKERQEILCLMGGWNALEAPRFDLSKTIRSGQFFRYREEHGCFLLLTQGRTIAAYQQEGIIRFRGCLEDEFRNLVGLTERHDLQLQELGKDAVLSEIVAEHDLLRIMALDPYETILGFICSSNSNIPRIRKNLDSIAHSYGYERCGNWFLPRPGIAMEEQVLRRLGLGYRAGYLARTSRIVTDVLLARLTRMPYEEVHEFLCTLPGVGPKVADCICLFALGHTCAFPVDVHVLRAMNGLFPEEDLKTPGAARAFALARWGSGAGLAQQFLFEHARTKLRADFKAK